MRRSRWLVAVGLVILLAVAALSWRNLGIFGSLSAPRAQPVASGDHEIAWIHAATNTATWERFVAGARHCKDEWPDLNVDVSGAFPDLTTGVPEVSLSLSGGPSKLRIRWYKLTSEMGIEQWVAELARRDPPPLAIIGGGSSDRARDLALALRKDGGWKGSPPLLLITTATADAVHVDPEPGAASPMGPPPDSVKLTDIYPGRTFRFCFQNSQMAEAVADFVWSQPGLRPHGEPARIARRAAITFGAGTRADVLLATLGPLPPLVSAQVFTIGYDDDPYSLDLADRFQRVLYRPERGVNNVTAYYVAYSVGDYNEPNRREAELVTKLAGDISHAPRERRMLVLPTLVQPARRVLRKLAVANPAAVRNVVAVTGDSINFNNIYRDRDVAWNVQEIPLPLVFFCHQDPVAWSDVDWQAPDLARRARSATDDVLLNSEMLRLIATAWQSTGTTADSDKLAENLRGLSPEFFARDGNRLGGSGEFVVCLRPHLKGEEVLASATAEVWRRDSRRTEAPGWQLHRRFEIEYDGIVPEPRDPVQP